MSNPLPEIRAADLVSRCISDPGGGPRRIDVRGARVVGSLDLSDRQVECSLYLTGCTFDEPIVLRSATCRTVCLDGSTVPRIDAEWVHVSGSVYLRHGFTANGCVRLAGATIDGLLDCRGAALINAGGSALDAGSLRATAVLLNDGFRAEGTVGCPAAQIVANFNADTATINAPGSLALNLERIETGGYVFLRARSGTRATFNGTVRLYRASIGANLELDGALANAAGGVAVEATGLNARGGVFLRYGFEAVGSVRLESAQIGTSLDCTGARFSHPGDVALSAPGVSTGRQLLLTTAKTDKGGNKCRVFGSISLVRASIGSDLLADGIEIDNAGSVALTARGASVHGDVSLNDARITGETYLPGAVIDGRLHLLGTVLDNGTARSLQAAGIKVGGSIFFGAEKDSRRFVANGTVILSQAQIGGSLRCDSATFNCPPGDSLHMYGAAIKTDAVFTNGFRSNGRLDLMATRIDGNLEMTDATLENPGDEAFSGERLSVGGLARLRSTDRARGAKFVATGQVRLCRANVLTLDCSDAHISNRGAVAVEAYGLTSTGDVFLRGLQVDGQVNLTNVRISGRLDLSASVIGNAGGIALSGERLSTGGDIIWRDAVVDGRVRLFGADCASFECAASRFRASEEVAFDMTLTRVRGSFIAHDAAWTGGVELVGCDLGGSLELHHAVFGGGLNLTRAHAATLDDRPDAWPAQNLRLDGFTYDMLGSDAPYSSADRRTWLARQPTGVFRPHVYDQLSRVLRQMGREREARDIAIARRDAAYDAKSTPIRKALMKYTIGYGYRPWLAIVWLLGFAAVGWGVFGWAGHEGAMTTGTGVAADANKAMFPFYPLMYSVDTLLPILDLQQEKYWFPNMWAADSGWIRWYLWLHIALGWVFASLVVGAWTGIIKKE